MESEFYGKCGRWKVSSMEIEGDGKEVLPKVREMESEFYRN